MRRVFSLLLRCLAVKGGHDHPTVGCHTPHSTLHGLPKTAARICDYPTALTDRQHQQRQIGAVVNTTFPYRLCCFRLPPTQTENSPQNEACWPYQLHADPCRTASAKHNRPHTWLWRQQTLYNRRRRVAHHESSAACMKAVSGRKHTWHSRACMTSWGHCAQSRQGLWERGRRPHTTAPTHTFTHTRLPAPAWQQECDNDPEEARLLRTRKRQTAQSPAPCDRRTTPVPTPCVPAVLRRHAGPQNMLALWSHNKHPAQHIVFLPKKDTAPASS